MRKTFLMFLFFTGLAAAQPFGLGLKLGTTLSDAISSLPSLHIANSAHFIVGPYVDVRLPLGLAVEADALYQRGLYNNIVSDGSRWQFPVVLKYRFLKGPIRPYIEGGPTFSRITDIAEIPELNHRNNFGIVVGGGVEVKLLVVRVTPEMRYYVMTLHDIQSVTVESNRGLATFTIGVGF
jgi:Outer membrane protein beta-barrel domain